MASQRQQWADEFTSYVRQRRARLYRTAYLICGDAHRAEDLVQVALTKAYRHWGRLSQSPFDGVDAYVRRAIVTSNIDDARRPWRRERPGLDGVEPAADEPLPVEDRDALWHGLRALPPGQRRVVILRHYWGLSVDETAADLGIAAGTVKSQTAAALTRLRTVLITQPAGGHHG